jgi:hypothetical protein
MKQFIQAISAGLFLAATGYGQITILQGDMPSAGDTIRMSLAISIPVDFTKTAADTTWDFSMLEPMNQRVDSFLSMNVVPNAYKIIFIPEFVANLAAPRNGDLVLPGFAVTDSYVFYKKNDQGFSEAGTAFTAAGFPFPLKYDTPDLYYSLPMSYGSAWNSASHAGLSLPGFGYMGSARIRSSIVDGWGTLITPFGTFDALRVKTDLVQNDSIHLDSSGIGIPINRHITEYKWLGKQQDEPLLQVNQEGGTVTAIYRDIYRQQANPMSVSLGPDTAVIKGHQITLVPVISAGVPPYRYIWSTFDTSATLTLTIDSTIQLAVVVFDAFNNAGTDMIKISVKYNPGIEEYRGELLGIRPNPSGGKAVVTFPELRDEATLAVFDIRGIPVLIRSVPGGSSQFPVGMEQAPDGFYSVVLQTAGETRTCKWIIHH